MLEAIYRNDHDFLSLAGIDTGPFPTPWGDGTDHGLTAALDLNVDLAKYDWAPELFGDVFLEQVGASMELNTGRSLQYGMSRDELPVYDPALIRHPEVDRGELALTAGFRHRPSDVRLNLGAGINTLGVRKGIQDPVHRWEKVNSPLFPGAPYGGFMLNAGLEFPF